jgi:hypothetical protein
MGYRADRRSDFMLINSLSLALAARVAQKVVYETRHCYN